MKTQQVSQNAQGLRLGPSNPHRLKDWHRGAAWSSRVNYLANFLKGRHPDFIGVQEQGSMVMAEQLARAYEKVCGGEYETLLGGDKWDISLGLHYRSDQFVLLSWGEITMIPFAPGHSHNKALWAELEHRTTGEQIVPVTTHLLSGRTSANIRDRGKQITDLMEQAPGYLPKGVPAVLFGDLNQSRENDGDPVGKALGKAGWIDAEASPCLVVNPSYDSSNQLTNPPIRHYSQIDRHAANPKHYTFLRREIMLNLDSKKRHRTPWPGDHQPVLTEGVTRI